MIDNSAFVTIGDDVMIGPNVHFITMNHPIDVAQRLQDIMYACHITIGSACWIGARATILPVGAVEYGCTSDAGAVCGGGCSGLSGETRFPNARSLNGC